MREAWADVPIVTVIIQPPPACPHCGSSSQPVLTRSAQNGDGSTTRKATCRICGGRFKVVAEPAQ